MLALYSHRNFRLLVQTKRTWQLKKCGNSHEDGADQNYFQDMHLRVSLERQHRQGGGIQWKPDG